MAEIFTNLFLVLERILRKPVVLMLAMSFPETNDSYKANLAFARFLTENIRIFVALNPVLRRRLQNCTHDPGILDSLQIVSSAIQDVSENVKIMSIIRTSDEFLVSVVMNRAFAVTLAKDIQILECIGDAELWKQLLRVSKDRIYEELTPDVKHLVCSGDKENCATNKAEIDFRLNSLENKLKEHFQNERLLKTYIDSIERELKGRIEKQEIEMKKQAERHEREMRAQTERHKREMRDQAERLDRETRTRVEQERQLKIQAQHLERQLKEKIERELQVKSQAESRERHITSQVESERQLMNLAEFRERKLKAESRSQRHLQQEALRLKAQQRLPARDVFDLW